MGGGDEGGSEDSDLESEPAASPSMRSTVAEIEAYADSVGVDLTGARTKAEKLARLGM